MYDEWINKATMTETSEVRELKKKSHETALPLFAFDFVNVSDLSPVSDSQLLLLLLLLLCMQLAYG
jgi:hypothetical protein